MRIVEEPMNRIAPFGGGETRSAASKARMSFSHFEVGAAMVGADVG
jgi:hypothetical protein